MKFCKADVTRLFLCVTSDFWFNVTNLTREWTGVYRCITGYFLSLIMSPLQFCVLLPLLCALCWGFFSDYKLCGDPGCESKRFHRVLLMHTPTF